MCVWHYVSGDSGWLPARLAQEIKHNRTVDLKGGKGKNVTMDRVCEFLNAEFKGKHLGPYAERKVEINSV